VNNKNATAQASIAQAEKERGFLFKFIVFLSIFLQMEERSGVESRRPVEHGRSSLAITQPEAKPRHQQGRKNCSMDSIVGKD
jgi:hypothetical protein